MLLIRLFRYFETFKQTPHENTWKNYLHDCGIVANLCAGLYAWPKITLTF